VGPCVFPVWLALRVQQSQFDSKGALVNKPSPHGSARPFGLLPVGPSMARIAIADDDPDSLALLSQALRGPTIEIREADSGVALVLLLAQEGPFHLVVTDVDMPWMDGPAVIKTARASALGAPVLFVTGFASAELEATVAELGNARLLRKPIEISALRDAAAALLGGSQ